MVKEPLVVNETRVSCLSNIVMLYLKFACFRTGERIIHLKRHGNESLGFKFKGGEDDLLQIYFYLLNAAFWNLCIKK